MSGSDCLLDTNVVLGCLGGHERVCSAIQARESSGGTFAISVITRMELLSYPDLTPTESAEIEGFLIEEPLGRQHDGLACRTAQIQAFEADFHRLIETGRLNLPVDIDELTAEIG